MDAFDASSDVEESQATQMLLDLIPGKDTSVKYPGTPARPSKAPSTMPTDLSSDSYTSSRNPNSLPTYHFHGLASTQTQSNDDEEEVNEGSQKENIKASLQSGNDSKQLLDHSIASPSRATSSRTTIMRAPDAERTSHSLSHSKAKTPNPRPVATTPFLLPRGRTAERAPEQKASSSNKLPSHTSARQSKREAAAAPSRDSSQDSFARDPSPDPEERFLAINKQFDVPLAQLGRIKLDATSPSRSSMYAFSLPAHGGPIVATPQGKVLVESTPSNSVSSQSDPSQLLSRSVDVETQPASPSYAAVQRTELVSSDGDESSEPASSFGRSLLDVRRPRTPEFEPTQPSTQPADDVDMTDVEPSTNPSGPSHGAATNPSGPSSRSTGPRSLISMVPTANRWRYKKYQAPTVPPPLPRINDASPMASAGQNVSEPHSTAPCWQETQPTTEEDLAPPRRQFPPPRSTKPSQLASSSPSRQQAPTPHVRGISDDPMDVVPDSEPLRSAQDDVEMDSAFSETKKRSASTSLKANLKKRAAEKRPSPISEDEAPEGTDDEDEESTRKKATVEQAEEKGQEGEAEPDDDDDDDVPLAAKRLRSSRATPKLKLADKGKRRAGRTKIPSATSSKSVQKGQKEYVSPPAPKAGVLQMKAPVVTYKTRSGKSWENGEVPSSVPEQDLIPPTLPKGNQRGKSTRGGRKASAPSVRSTSTSSKARSRQVPAREEEPASDLDDLSSLTRDEDDTTEPADEEYMDIGSPEPGPSSRKRKRGVPVAQTVVKLENKKKGKAASPPAKRLRSAVASAKRGQQPTRVFALWKGDNHFYAGTVHSMQDHMRYLVKFDDSTEAPVTIEQMRLGELRVGDDVLLPEKTLSCKVVKVDKAAKGLITVKLEGVNQEVELNTIRIAHKTISFAWGDRLLTRESVITVLKPNPIKPSPSPSKASLINLPPYRGSAKKKLLARTGLVITLSVANANWERDKDRVMAAVRASGGTVIEDMVALFGLQGTFEESGNRWLIQKTDVTWNGDSHQIQRLFLLADDTNQKPKFLMALALGIPCLSTNWLHSCVSVGSEQEWLPFLLPQGFSEALHARLTQQVDIDWGSSIHHMKNIMSNTVASKVFNNAFILCIGHDIMPQPHGKRHPDNDLKSQEAINALARVMLCMGAEYVEAVLDPEYASLPFSDYTYIITRNPTDDWPELPRSKMSDWAWVKNCLIAGRLCPMHPEKKENSQEA